MKRARALTRVLSTAATQPAFQQTVLPNKLRVATQNAPGHFASVGVFVDVGTRYESALTAGSSHFLDRLAYKSTKTRSADEMMAAVDGISGQIVSSASRESMMYQSSHFAQHTDKAVEILADAALNPTLAEEEVEEQRDASRWELRELTSKPDSNLPEVLHDIAFSGETLGRSVLCPEDRIDVVSSATLHEFHRTWYRPDRMVLAAAGVPHEQLVELATKHFGHLENAPQELLGSTEAVNNSTSQRTQPPTPLLTSSNSSSSSVYKTLSRAASSYLYPPSLLSQQQNEPSGVPSFAELASKAAQYTGGHRFIHDTKGDFSHVYLAFLGPHLRSPNIYAMATLQILLGGGGAFSAGGPGKGMFSRLYTNILNRHSQVEHCQSFQHIYSDATLFGLFASFAPNAGASVVLAHLANQLGFILHSPVPRQELQRAKNQLMSALVMALESRAVEVEDLGRQLLLQEERVTVSDMTDKIRAVTADDLHEVAEMMYGATMTNSGRQPTILLQGREDVADWKETLFAYGLGR
ncbi:mitochondrial processing peptidase [Auriculariales sp. MPI-PUGE-AT-0066]|nr:mitochondrial processing peptidase [Auriculariales sp. MPI-PUGE-AT-0066]